MSLQHGQDFEFVQFWNDKDHHGPILDKTGCQGSSGAVGIMINPNNGTRTISASYLLKSLGWQSEQSVRCPISWDSENNAAVVIMTTPSL